MRAVQTQARGLFVVINVMKWSVRRNDEMVK